MTVLWESYWEPMLNAIKEGNVQQLKEIIGTNGAVNYESTFSEAKYNPLYTAVEYNQYECAKLLIEKGANTTFKSFLGYTPLIESISTENLNLIKLLLDNGAETQINQQDEGFFSSKSPLAVAAELGNLPVAELLISRGADIHQKVGISENASILTYAVEANHIDMAKFLISQGVSVNTLTLNESNDESSEPGSKIFSAYQTSPLFIASVQKNIPMVKLLLDAGADDLGWTNAHKAAALNDITLLDQNTNTINAIDSLGMHPIQYGLIHGNKDLLEKFYALGADLSMTEDGTTLLHQLVSLHAMYDYTNVKELLDWLHDHSLDLNAADSDGETSLMIALHIEQTEPMEWLLNKGADLNMQDNQGQTALHHAIESEYFDRAIKMIEAGAEVNLADKQGNTPLHSAVKENAPQVIEVLLAKGADLTAVNHEQKNAYQMALDNHASDTVLSMLKPQNIEPAIEINDVLQSADITSDFLTSDQVAIQEQVKFHQDTTLDSLNDTSSLPLETF